MKKFFIILFVSIVATVMGGCLNLEGILPFLNKAPVIISKPIITATEDQLYLYQIEASDPNGDTLTYSFIIKPEGMSIDSESGLISWIPANNQVGIHQIIVEISDGKQSVAQSFEIEVFNVNNPPLIFSYFPVNLNFDINEGDSVKFEVQTHDIDSNTTLSYQWLLNGMKVSSSTVSGDGSKSSWIYFTGYGDYGQKRVKVVVSDGELQDYVQWNITINDITPPAQPTLNTVTLPTNIPAQTLSGNKESNTSIWINGVEVISVNSVTTWSYSYNLSEGENNISIISKDTMGNESNKIYATIILDTIAPAIPNLEAVSSPTNISSQILSGTKEDNSSILINDTEVVSINSSTDWSHPYNLSEGINNISVTSRDAAGNESLSITTNIILDTISPMVPTLNSIISPTNISTQVLRGTKEAETAILINGTEVIPINSETTWSYSLYLTEGTNSIFITSCDAVGNESAAVNNSITLDTIPPTTPTIHNIISPTNICTQLLSGNKEINSSILVNGVEVIFVNSVTTWSYSYNLSEGENNISIISKDTMGNESNKIYATIILDTIAPAIPNLEAVTSPTNISPQILSGTKDTNSSILINGAEIISLNSSTNWSYSYNLSEGNNDISITSQDAAGNESSVIIATIECDPNIYVDAANVTGIEDGTKTYPFNTITEGIDAVISGKSVMVTSGTYNEQLIISKSITLQGAEKESTIISGFEYTGNLITIEADGVKISGFKIDGISDTDVGIYSDSSSSIEISENIIQNQQDSGILYHSAGNDYSSGIYVYNNEICFNSKNGIKVTGEGSGIIESNTIRKNTNGIRTSNSASLEIKHNNINDNTSAGILCQDSSFLLIWGNEITINDYGIKVGVLSSDTTNPDIGGGTKDGVGQNKIAGNKTHGVSNKTTHNIMAKNNWWGDAAGPKYPGNPNNATISSDWAYWSNIDGTILFNPYSTEP